MKTHSVKNHLHRFISDQFDILNTLAKSRYKMESCHKRNFLSKNHQNENYWVSEVFQQNHHYVFFFVFVSIKTVDSTASADIWHRRMGHLDFLGFHHLGKQCLKVRLKNSNMSQCDACAKIKMTNQVFRRPPINQSIRPFYKINIDWEGDESKTPSQIPTSLTTTTKPDDKKMIG